MTNLLVECIIKNRAALAEPKVMIQGYRFPVVLCECEGQASKEEAELYKNFTVLLNWCWKSPSMVARSSQLNLTSQRSVPGVPDRADVELSSIAADLVRKHQIQHALKNQSQCGKSQNRRGRANRG